MCNVDLALQVIGNLKKTYKGSQCQFIKDVANFLVKHKFLSEDLSLEMKEVTANIFILCAD